jgi:DNA-binding NarL/FixJ family response regulator
VIGRPTVLIVDDFDTIREMLRFHFDADGRFRVVGEAGDGVSAVALVRQHHPSVVILDLALPRMDGFEVLKLIKDEFPETRVVVLSAFDLKTMDGQPALARADRYIEKGPRMKLVDVASEVLAAPAH